MKTLKRNRNRRVALIALALFMLMTVLTGCGNSSSTSTLTYKENAFTLDKDEMSQHGIEPSQFTKIAKIIVSAYNADYDAREALVAASRGYDMTAEGFSDEGEFPNIGMNLTAAKNVIAKANEKATADQLTDAELKTIQDKLNDADVSLLIDAFRTDLEPASNGLWDSIMNGIGTALNWMTQTLGFGNYVIGICIFAIAVEILMIPLAIKQQKNSIKQANLRPKEMAIKNKYKGRNDQPTMQKMQQEIQELYQRENFSPASGCLPLLIQLPIIMILYSIVVDPLHYVLGQGADISTAINTFATTAKAAGGMGLSLNSSRGTIELLTRLRDSGADMDLLSSFGYFRFGDGVLDSLRNALTSIPNFNIGALNFGLTPGFTAETWPLLMVPVLTFVTYFVTAKLNRKFMYQSVANEGMDQRQVACSNSMMDITMPAMSTFFTLAVPGVLGIYWAFRSWIGFAKTVIVSKVMPLPTFTDEDYKAAAREMAGKKVVEKKSSKVNAVRSLHYIDDEDFEDTRERGLARRAAIEERERKEQEERANKTPFASVPLKKNEKKEKKESAEAEKVKPSVQDTDASEQTGDTARTGDETTEPVKHENDNNKDEV